MTAMEAVSATKSAPADQPRPGCSAASLTGGLPAALPHTARPASTPRRDPASWATI